MKNRAIRSKLKSRSGGVLAGAASTVLLSSFSMLMLVSALLGIPGAFTGEQASSSAATGVASTASLVSATTKGASGESSKRTSLANGDAASSSEGSEATTTVEAASQDASSEAAQNSDGQPTEAPVAAQKDATQPTTLEKKLKSVDGHTYTVRVTYGPEANVPEGAELQVVELNQIPADWDDEQKQANEYKDRPYATEALLSADDMAKNTEELSRALEIGEDGRILWNKTFDVSLVADEQTVTLNAEVQVEVETDAILAAESDALETALLKADGSRRLQVTNATGTKEGEADKPADGLASRVKFATTELGRVGLAEVAQRKFGWVMHGDEVSVYGARAVKTDPYEVPLDLEYVDGLRLIEVFEVEVDPTHPFGTTLWVESKPAQDAQPSFDGVLGYRLVDGRAERAFGLEGTGGLVPFSAGGLMALVWDSGMRQTVLDAGDVTLAGEMPVGTTADAQDVTGECTDARALVPSDEDEQARTLAAYNVSLSVGGTEWNPGADPVRVKLADDAIDPTSGQKLYDVVRVGEDGATPVTAKVEDGAALFDMGEGGSYAVVERVVVEREYAASDGKTYKITVGYDTASGFPKNAVLVVNEVKVGDEGYDAYLKGAASELGADVEDVTYVKELNISVVNPETGQEFQPTKDLDVSIELLDRQPAEGTKLGVVHFGDDGKTEVVDAKAEGNTVEFNASGFSVYVIVDHEGGVVENPRVEFHFIDRYTDEQYAAGVDVTEPTTADPYNFVNLDGTYQTTQILKDGETLVLINDPANVTLTIGDLPVEKYFYGWYVVDASNDTTSLNPSTGKYEGAITFQWPEDPDQIAFEKAVNIEANDANADGKITVPDDDASTPDDTVTWTLNGVTGTAVLDSKGTAHVYLAPLYEDFYFINFHKGTKDSEESLKQSLMVRKLVVFGSGTEASVRIGNVVCESSDPTHKIFSGWEKDNGDGANPRYTAYKTVEHTIDSRGDLVNVEVNEPSDGVGYYITVTKVDKVASVDLYPIFDEARWLYFNRGATGNGSTYVGSSYRLSNDDRDDTDDSSYYYFDEAFFKSDDSTQGHLSRRAGYSFDGWYLFANMDENKSEITNLTTAQDVEVKYLDDFSAEQSTTINTAAIQVVDGDGNIQNIGAWYVAPNGTISQTASAGSRKLFEADGNKIRFYKAMNDMTLYAKWTPIASTEYSVIVWKESMTDTYADNTVPDKRNFDFVKSYTFAGAPNTPITAVSRSSTSKVDDAVGTYYNAVINGQKKDGTSVNETLSGDEYKGYYFGKYDENVTIAPEGTSVVNVYYYRNVVTYQFYTYGKGETGYTCAPNETTLPQFGRVDGEFVELKRESSTVWQWNAQESYASTTSSTEPEEYALINGEYVLLTPVEHSDISYVLSQGNSTTAYTGSIYYISSSNWWSGDQYDEVDWMPSYNDGYSYYYYYYNSRWDNGYSPLTWTSITVTTNTYQLNDVDYEGTRYVKNSGSIYTGVVYIRAGDSVPYTYSLIPDNDKDNNPQKYGVDSNGGHILLSGADIEVFSWTRKSDSTPYTGTRWVKTTMRDRQWNLYRDEIGLYGEKLAWPNDPSLWWYETKGTNSGSGTRMTYKDAFLPLTDDMTVEYWASNASGTLIPINFYIQNIDDSSSYTLAATVNTQKSNNGNSFSINDKFAGFNAYQYRSDNGSWQNVGAYNSSTGIYGSAVSYRSSLDIRYNRKKSDFVFFTNYPTGKNLTFNGVAEDDSAVVKNEDEVRVEDILYGASLSEYSNYYNIAENEPTGVTLIAPDHYTFGGWYKDDTCQEEFDFNGTMPDGNATAYAKWTPETFWIKVNPDGGEINRINQTDDYYVTLFTRFGGDPNPLFAGDYMRFEQYYGQSVLFPGSGNTSVGQATYYNVDYGELASEYNVPRRFVAMSETAAASYSGDVYYYLNYQLRPTDGASGIYTHIRSSVYVREQEIQHYYDLYAAIVDYSSTALPDDNEGMTLLDFDTWKSLYVSSTKYRPVNSNENWTFLGWYKTPDGGTEESMPYNFNDPVTGPFTLTAHWRLDGGYRIEYVPKFTMPDGAVINGSMPAWSDPIDETMTYADGAKTEIYKAPTNLTKTTTSEGTVAVTDDSIIFRGWALVSKKADGTYEPVETDSEGNITTYYYPSDPYTVNAANAGNDSRLYFQAIYQYKGGSDRQPKVTNLKLDANGGYVNAGYSGIVPDLPAWDAYPGISAVNTTDHLTTVGESRVPTQIAFGGIQSSAAVQLYKYATDQDIIAADGNNYFTSPEGHFLLGFDDNATEGDYVATYSADSVIAVTRDDDKTIYAVWEPMVYMTFTNETDGEITFSLSPNDPNDTASLEIINVKNGMYDRKKLEDFDEITLKAKGDAEGKDSITLAFPKGAEKDIKISGTNELGPGKVLMWDSSVKLGGDTYNTKTDTGSMDVTYTHTTTSGEHEHTLVAGERNNREDFDFTESLIVNEDPVTVTFSSRNNDYALIFDDNFPAASGLASNTQEIDFAKEKVLTSAEPVGVKRHEPLPDPDSCPGYQFLGWASTPGATTPEFTASIENMQEFFEVEWPQRVNTVLINNNETVQRTLYAVWQEYDDPNTVYIFKTVPTPGNQEQAFTFDVAINAGYTPTGQSETTFNAGDNCQFTLKHNQYAKLYTEQHTESNPISVVMTVTLYNSEDDSRVNSSLGETPDFTFKAERNVANLGGYLSKTDISVTERQASFYTTSIKRQSQKQGTGITLIGDQTTSDPLTVTGTQIKWNSVSQQGTIIYTNQRDTYNVTVAKTLVSNTTTAQNFYYAVSYDDGGTVTTLHDTGNPFRVSSDDSSLLEDIPAGVKLTITELTDDDDNYSIETDGAFTSGTNEGSPITDADGDNKNADFVIDELTGNATVTYHNTLKSYKVSMKLVDQDGAPLHSMFALSSSIGSLGTDLYAGDGGVFYTSDRFWADSYTLSQTTTPSGYLSLQGTPITLTVTGNGITSNSSWVTVDGNATEGYIIVVKNWKQVDVTVKKVLNDILLSGTRQFSFDYGYTSAVDGTRVQGTINLSPTANDPAGASRKLQIPINSTDFTVTEPTSDAYNSAVSYAGDDSYSASGLTCKIDLVRNSDTIQFVNSRKVAHVTVKKAVKNGTAVDGSRAFDFTADLQSSGNSIPFGVFNDGNGVYVQNSFTLDCNADDATHPDSVTFTVPVGAALAVAEDTTAEVGTMTVGTVYDTSSAVTNGDASFTANSGSSFTLTVPGEDCEVTVTNARKYADVTINKTMVDPLLSSETFAFIGGLTEVDGTNITSNVTDLSSFTIDASTEAVGQANTHTGSRTFSLPVGAALSVEEDTTQKIGGSDTVTVGDVYTTTSENNEHVTVSETGNDPVSFTNTRNTQTVTVSKKLVDVLKSGSAVGFGFTVTLYDVDGTTPVDGYELAAGTPAITTGSDGSATFILTPTAASTEVEATEITQNLTVPYGTKLVVAEIPVTENIGNGNVEVYDTSIKVDGSDSDGTLENITESKTVSFTNTRKTNNLTIRKTVKGSDTSGSFRITARLAQGEVPVRSYEVGTDNGDNTLATNSDGQVTFSLGHNGTQVIKVPVGANVTVQENLTDEQKAAFEPFIVVPGSQENLVSGDEATYSLAAQTTDTTLRIINNPCICKVTDGSGDTLLYRLDNNGTDDTSDDVYLPAVYGMIKYAVADVNSEALYEKNESESGVTFALFSGTAYQVQMLCDYTVPNTDVVPVGAGHTLTFTTASPSASDGYPFRGGVDEGTRATLTCENSYPMSLITVTGAEGNTTNFIMSNLVIHGDQNAQLDSNVHGGVLNAVGSVVTINNCKVTNFSAADGGAVYANGGSLTVTDSVFQGCKANNGGGIYMDSGTLDVSNSTIESCEATANGGGLFVGSSATATIQSGIITKNEAVNGGGIYVDGNSALSDDARGALNVSGGSITENTATGNGSAVYLNDYARANVSGGSISANVVTETAGAVGIAGGNARINFSNAPVIYNNTYGDGSLQNNVMLSVASDQVINVTAALTDGAKIGVMPTYDQNRKAGDPFGMTVADGANSALEAFINDYQLNTNGLTMRGCPKTEGAGDQVIWQRVLEVEVYKYTSGGYDTAEQVGNTMTYLFPKGLDADTPVTVDNILSTLNITAPDGYAYDTAIYGDLRNTAAIYQDSRMTVHVRKDDGSLTTTLVKVKQGEDWVPVYMNGSKLKVYYYETNNLIPVLVEKEWKAPQNQITANDDTAIGFGIKKGESAVTLYTDSISISGSPRETIAKGDEAILGNSDSATSWAKLLYLQISEDAGNYTITETTTPTVADDAGAWVSTSSVKDLDAGDPLNAGVWTKVEDENLAQGYLKLPCILTRDDYENVESFILYIESVDGYCYRTDVKLDSPVSFVSGITYYVPVLLPKDVPYCALILPQSNGHNVVPNVVNPYQSGETFYGIKTINTTGGTHQPRYTELGLYDNGQPNSTGGPIIFKDVAFVTTADESTGTVLTGSTSTAPTLRVFARKRFTMTNSFNEYPMVEVYQYTKGAFDSAELVYSGKYSLPTDDSFTTVEDIKSDLLGQNKYTVPDGYDYDTAMIGEMRNVTSINLANKYKVGTYDTEFSIPDGEALKIYYVKSDHLQPVVIRKEWDAPDSQKAANENSDTLSIPLTVNGGNEVYPSNAKNDSAKITTIAKADTATVVGMGQTAVPWAKLAFVPMASSFTIAEDPSDLTVSGGTNGEWNVSYPAYASTNSYNDWATVASQADGSLTNEQIAEQTDAQVAYLRVKNNEIAGSSFDKLRVMYKDIDGVTYESYVTFASSAFESKGTYYVRILIPKNVDLQSLELLYNGDAFYNQEPLYNSLSSSSNSYGFIIGTRAPKFKQTGFYRNNEDNRAFVDIAFLNALPDGASDIDFTSATLKVYAPTRLTMKNSFTRSFTASKNWVDVPSTEQANLEAEITLYKVTGTGTITVPPYVSEADAAGEKAALEAEGYSVTEAGTCTLREGAWSYTFTGLPYAAEYYAVETAVKNTMGTPDTADDKTVTEYIAVYDYGQAKGTLTVENGDYIARVSNDNGATWTYHRHMINSGEGVTGSDLGAFDKANSLSGDVIIETLKETAVYEDENRYALTSGVEISNPTSITLRTTQDDRWNPSDEGHFRTTLIRGTGNTGSMFTVPANKSFTTEYIILDGGAKFDDDGNVADGGITFSGDGGLVNVSGTLDLSKGTTLQNTVSTGSGSAVYVQSGASMGVSGAESDGVTFVNCHTAATATKHGGAVFTTQTADLNVEYASFLNCAADKGGGGAFNIGTAKYNMTATFRSCAFTKCKAMAVKDKEGAGAIRTYGHTLKLYSCSFDHCSAVMQGGAIHQLGTTELFADNCTFTSCSAGNNSNKKAAGALETSAEKITIQNDCQFVDCTSTRNAGAVNVYRDENSKFTITISDTTFQRCNARTVINDQGAGGCLRVTSNDQATIDITDCSFEDSHAQQGGAIFCNGGTTTISGKTSINGCSATVNGGGVYLNKGTLVLSGGTIENCTAPNGGGVYMGGGTCNLNSGSIKTCAATASNGLGGGVYLGDGILKIAGGRIEGCIAPHGGGVYQEKGTFNFSNGYITGCEAKGKNDSKGGGVYMGGGTLNFNGGNVYECTATGNGGGFDLEEGAFNLKGGTISRCHAGSNGGGAYIGGGSFVFSDGLINQCYAKAGGGVYIQETEKDKPVRITKNGDAITNCDAADILTVDEDDNKTCTYSEANRGGGIYQCGGELVIEQATIDNCSAYDGGGIYLDGTGSDLKFSGTIGGSNNDDKNSAVNGGGIYQKNGTLTIDDGHIKGNTATADGNGNGGFGGGIYLGGGSFTLKSGEVGGLNDDDQPEGGNTAKFGGGLYVANGTSSDDADLTKAHIKGGKLAGNHAAEPAGGGGIYIGGPNVRLYFEGDIQVWGNTMEPTESNPLQTQCDVCLSEHSNEIIRTTSAGLEEDSHIGVYVTDDVVESGDDAGKQLHKDLHGTTGLPFGTFDGTANGKGDRFLNRFINNRTGNAYQGYEYYYGVRKPDDEDAQSVYGPHRIYWVDYVCEITDARGSLLFTNAKATAPALYQYLDQFGAFEALRGHIRFYNKDKTPYTGTEYYVKMLKFDYSLHWSSSIEVPANGKITLTMAPEDDNNLPEAMTGQSYADHNGCATIKRGKCTGSMFRTSSRSDFVLTNVTIDGEKYNEKTGEFIDPVDFDGGLINAYSNLTLGVNTVLKNSYINDKKSGGAVCFSGDGTLTMNNVVSPGVPGAKAKIVNCKAEHGAALGVVKCEVDFGPSNSIGTAFGGTIENCKSTNGLVYVVSGTLNTNYSLKGNKDATDEDHNFVDCTSVNGGLVFLNGGELNVKGSISNFSGATNGGALYLNAGTANLYQSIESCSATNGGAAYVKAGTLNLQNTVSNCEAITGGAIYVGGGTVNLQNAADANSLITRCKASGNGGAVCINGNGILNMTGEALTDDDGIKNCEADVGGAIYTNGTNTTINISAGAISENIAKNSSNRGGGAVRMQNGGTMNVSGTALINNNKAEGSKNAYGGAVSVKNGTMIVSGGTFSNNEAKSTASAYGGAIYVSANCSLTLSGGTFIGNKAKTDGACIYLAPVDPNIVGSVPAILNISGAPKFGTDVNGSTHETTDDANTVTKGDYEQNKNGQEQVYIGDNVRQDIYLGEASGSAPQSIVVTGDLVNENGDRDGSIWVWAENGDHYKQLMPFAKPGSGVEFYSKESDSDSIPEGKFDAAHLKVFRNARADGETENATDTWLYGTLEENKNDYIYWTGVAGFRKVILKKVDSSYSSVSGRSFTIYRGANQTPYTPQGETNALSDLTSDSTGCFWVGTLPHGWYIVKEANPERYFYIIVDSSGVYGTLFKENGADAVKVGGYENRADAEAEAAARYAALRAAA